MCSQQDVLSHHKPNALQSSNNGLNNIQSLTDTQLPKLIITGVFTVETGG